MSTQHLHLAVNGKAQTKGHVPGNCRFSLGIVVLRVRKTDAGLSSLILCVLETVNIITQLMRIISLLSLLFNNNNDDIIDKSRKINVDKC